MDIVIIGTGNAATVLGRRFKAAGHTILQVAGRNSAAASALAYELDTVSTNYWTSVNKNADVYIIAVSDNAIDDIIAELKLPGKVIAHTAAAVPKEILKPVSNHYGVFYPLQSLRKETESLPDIPLFVDGSDEKTISLLEKLAHSVSAEKVVYAGNDERVKLHVAAVFVNNFTNYLYVLAEEYCKKEGIDFKLLLPLIEETALRVKNISPRSVQTGPAMRHDDETIQKHLELLKAYPELKKVYAFLSENIEKLK
jgi:predicted short-subunit dehydrogenase-like oxidoreductase (DUF2520 family)